MTKSVKNSMNYTKEKHGVINKQPSVTVPAKTMTVTEIMKRYANGMPLGGAKMGIYDPNPELAMGINPKTLDLVDIQTLERQNREWIKETQARIKKDQTDRAEQHAKKILEDKGE